MYEDDKMIQGFIGVSDEYIEGIFVSDEMQSRGIGKILHPMGIIFHLVNKQAVHPLLPWVFKFQTIPNSSHILFLL